MTRVRWTATVTVDVIDETTSDYQGESPEDAAVLGWREIMSLEAPVVEVRREVVDGTMVLRSDVTMVDLEEVEF